MVTFMNTKERCLECGEKLTKTALKEQQQWCDTDCEKSLFAKLKWKK